MQERQGDIQMSKSKSEAECKLFISHSTDESNIANVLNTLLVNAFDGKLEKSFVSGDLRPGEKWKERIREELAKCAGGIFILTPTFQKSQWYTAEFTAFWFQDKEIAILTIDEENIDFQSNFELMLMRDYQIGSLTSVRDVKKLIQTIHSNILHLSLKEDIIPVGEAKRICEAVKREYQKASKRLADELYKNIQKHIEYIQFRYTADNLMILKDHQLYEIINSTIDNTFRRLIIQKIVDKKRDVALINVGIEKLSDFVDGSNVELRKFVVYLLRNSRHKESYFDTAINKMTNDNEMLKILIQMYSVNRELCIEYYFHKKIIRNEKPKERMKEFLKANGENVEELLSIAQMSAEGSSDPSVADE
jgi:hypothetical protein